MHTEFWSENLTWRALERPERKWEDDTKMDITETWRGCGLESSGFRQGPVVGSCGQGNETSGFTKEDSLTSRSTVGFSRRTLQYGVSWMSAELQRRHTKMTCAAGSKEIIPVLLHRELQSHNCLTGIWPPVRSNIRVTEWNHLCPSKGVSAKCQFSPVSTNMYSMYVILIFQLCCRVKSPEDGGSMFPRNVGIYLRVYTASEPKRTTSTTTSPSSPSWEPQVSQEGLLSGQAYLWYRVKK
jgi:hypothetical protein